MGQQAQKNNEPPLQDSRNSEALQLGRCSTLLSCPPQACWTALRTTLGRVVPRTSSSVPEIFLDEKDQQSTLGISLLFAARGSLALYQPVPPHIRAA